MEKPHIINLRTAFISAMIGLAIPIYQGSLFRPEFSYFAVGFLMLILTPGVKNENKIAAHVIVLLSLFLVIFSGFKLVAGYTNDPLEVQTIGRAIVAIINLVALVLYIKRFISISKQKKQQSG